MPSSAPASTSSSTWSASTTARRRRPRHHGEGALDEQTLHGKAPAGVAAAAAARGIPVVAVCGVNRLDADRLHGAGIAAAYALTDLEPDVARCISDGAPLLTRLGQQIAAEHLPVEATA